MASLIEDQIQRETLQVTLASIGDGVIVTDAHGKVTFINPMTESLTGWPLAEALGQPLQRIFRILNEHTREAVEDPVEKVLKSGGIVGLANHTLLIRRDGKELPIDDSAAPIRLPDGTLFGIVLIFRDITQRYESDRTRNWLAAIIESSDDAIASKTLDGIVTSWNSGTQRLFGYLAEEIIGKHITTIIPHELHQQEREILAQLRAGQRIDHFDTVRVRKDGSFVDISLTVSPIRDGSGRIIGASKVARDITERKRLERELKLADQRKDEFLATLAHELRNPLAPIRMAADVIARTPLHAGARSACEIIQRQVSQMARLVDELLDVARINTGRINLMREPLDVREVISMAIESCRPGLESKSHALRISMPQEPLVVAGDRVRLAQVFANILGNAVKYTSPNGLIEVTARTDGERAAVSFKDNGVGINPARLNEVFELFCQLDRSYGDTTSGLGIGLALAQRLVQMHDGQIEAQSNGPGTGSEFIVRLPTISASSVQPIPERAQSAAPPSRKVLIADDNRDAATSLAMLLEMAGHETRVVFDGQSAIEAAEEYHPHVMLVDIGMPKLNGYEVARILRARPWASDSLLVALTGWGQEADRQRALAAGFDRHLVKPVSEETLTSVLKEQYDCGRGD
jgi:PAS domain S-box-containing protein